MSTNEIIAAVAAGKMTPDEAARQLDRQLSFKVSEKGGVSVYGLYSRYPVTLYRDQWDKLFQQTDDIKSFITANEKSLKGQHTDIESTDAGVDADLKPSLASNTEDQAVENSLPRTGMTPLSFLGTLLTRASSTDGYDNPKKQPSRYYTVAVFRSASGKYVVHIDYTTHFRSENGHSEVLILDDPAKVAQALTDHDPLAYVAGWPPLPVYEGRQERLLADLELQYDTLVSKVLDRSEFAERV